MPPRPATSVAAPIPGSVTPSAAAKKRHEPYVLIDDSDLSLDARRFLTGGALLIGFMFTNRAAVAPEPTCSDGAMTPRPPAFAALCLTALSDRSDDRIVFVVPSVEMGQGIYTGEAMMIAEELEVGLDQVEVAAAPPDGAAYTQSLLKAQATGGSTSVRAFFTPLRQAGAAARTMLVAAAAARWQVLPQDCVADRAVVSHPASGRHLSYGLLANDARRQPTPSAVPLKPASQFKLIGKPLKRVDTPAKVNGTAQFGIDAMIPGMRTAALLICPTIGGRLRSLDDRAARAAPGVVDVLRIDDAVAVIGEHYWVARKALDLLDVTWDEGPFADLSSAALAHALATAEGTPISGALVGDPDEALRGAPIRLEATYDLPYLAHAALEPINTTIHVRPDRCDIWVGTQVPEVARTVVAEIVDLPPEKVMVATT